MLIPLLLAVALLVPAAAGQQDTAPATLSRDRARADLADVSAGLRERFAYLHLRRDDLLDDVDALAAELPAEVDVAWLAHRLHRILMTSGDGHARVRSRAAEAAEPRGSLPFVLYDAVDGVRALLADRSDWLDPEHPFVHSLDGEPLEDWLAAVRPDVPAGSPQLVRLRTLAALSDLAALRQRRGRPAAETLTVVLRAADPSRRREWELPLAPRRLPRPAGPDRPSGRLEGGVGYLRLAGRDDAAAEHVHQMMAVFREAPAVIVDVRGNGGGNRRALLALAGYLIGADQGPWVGNVACYKRAREFGLDHLAARFMQPVDAPTWTPAQRTVIDACMADFSPEWDPGPGFSPWHVLLLDHGGDPREFAYPGRVLVLCDSGSFSATDIFLGALELHPRVTLVGQPSGGGSARSQRFTLPRSGIEVTCASMASFRPDGRLYDGRGVEVDVEVRPDPDDVLRDSGQDQVLSKALSLLRRGSR